MNTPDTVHVLRPHISLDVSNLDASITFYSALFGIAPSKQKPDYAKFEVANPPLNFALNLNAAKQSGGWLNHLGFEVASSNDVLHTKSRLEASGLATFDEMNVACCYAVQDKIWVHDPDGNPWEVFVVTEKNIDSFHGEINLGVLTSGTCCTADAPTTNERATAISPGCC